ncbi:hypothetical protein DF186_25060 [Enterococcus hirae]|nr:hypothetical protein DF186_25060 [Enterococcus hirae]
MMMIDCFFGELFDAVNNCGFVAMKREDMYCMVEANRVFLYYCWYSLKYI